MKDSEFIELLNLYLDHEISAADAARLEAEVQTSAARRGIYQQYCRMQKACKLAVADFETAEVGVADDDKKVVAFDSAAMWVAAQRRRMGGFYMAGSIAAMAACVAFVFIGRNRSEPDGGVPSAPVIAQTTGAAEVEVIAQSAAIPQAPTRGLVWVAQSPDSARLNNPLLLTGNTQAEAVFTAAVQQANHQLAWIDAVQLAPLPQGRVSTNDLHFDATMRSEERALGGRGSSGIKQQQPATEMSAFQFRK